MRAQAIAYASFECVPYKLAIILHFFRLSILHARMESLRRAWHCFMSFCVVVWICLLLSSRQFLTSPKWFRRFFFLFSVFALLHENKITHSRNKVQINEPNVYMCGIPLTDVTKAKNQNETTMHETKPNTMAMVTAGWRWLLNKSRKYKINRLM